jgi:hypothetical protein
MKNKKCVKRFLNKNRRKLFVKNHRKNSFRKMKNKKCVKRFLNKNRRKFLNEKRKNKKKKRKRNL